MVEVEITMVVLVSAIYHANVNSPLLDLASQLLDKEKQPVLIKQQLFQLDRKSSHALIHNGINNANLHAVLAQLQHIKQPTVPLNSEHTPLMVKLELLKPLSMRKKVRQAKKVLDTQDQQLLASLIMKAAKVEHQAVDVSVFASMISILAMDPLVAMVWHTNEQFEYCYYALNFNFFTNTI